MREVGRSYKREKPAGAFDAIVIGSGIGGLTTAAALAKLADKRVLVLERHTTAGGYTHSFTRPGFEWDVGVHYIGQVGERGSLRPAFDWLTEGRLDWAPLPDVYDRIVLGDRAYDFPSGRRRFAEAMKDRFPREARVIDRYLDAVRAAGRWSVPFFASRAIPRAAAALAGPLLRAPLLRWSARTVAEVLSGLGASAELAAVLAGQWGDYGLPPSRASFAIHAMVAGHYLGGAWFPVGGASRIAAGIAPVVESRGGAVFIGAEVERVIVERGRAVGVRMADGVELRAPVIVSAAGLAITLGKLLSSDDARATGLVQPAREVGPSYGHAALYLGLGATDAELGLNGTNLWLYPGADHDAAVARYERDRTAPLPLVYVSFPSAKDPSFAERHPGRATIDVITLAHWDDFASWAGTRWQKRGAEYDDAKARLGERMSDALFAALPAIRDKVVWKEVSTPLTTSHFASWPRGELYGLDHTPARFRMPVRAATSIPGLYLAGQDVATAGVAGGMMGGALAASAILGRNVVSAMMRRT